MIEILACSLAGFFTPAAFAALNGGQPCRPYYTKGSTWNRQAQGHRRLVWPSGKRWLASKFVLGVLKALTRPATQAQLDAMVDLAYKIGASVFQSFTLVRLFIAGD